MKTAAFSTCSRVPARERVVLGFVLVTLCVVMVYRRWPASPLWLPLAVAGIALAIWHGAYDAVLAEKLWQPRFQRRWIAPFFLAYIGLALLIVVAWWVFPVPMLAIFLLYSGIHFGTEQDAGSTIFQTVSAATFGFIPIAAACHWQGDAVLPIFTAMLRGRADSAKGIASAAGSVLLPFILIALLGAASNRAELTRRTALIAAELILFRLCPPVVGFGVFFCAFHTPEHLLETSRDFDGTFSIRQMMCNLRRGFIPWATSVAAVAVIAWMGWRTAQGYVGLLFIALSALTVPHLVLGLFASARNHHGVERPLQALEGAAGS